MDVHERIHDTGKQERIKTMPTLFCDPMKPTAETQGRIAKSIVLHAGALGARHGQGAVGTNC